MLKKLALDQTKKYEKYLVLEELSIMLLNFVNGRPHHLAIGAEQGDIDKWDDLVIQTNTDGYIYIQAKRQTTDFSSDPIIRDNYHQGPRKGVPRDLSPLDETLKSLGKRVSQNDPNSAILHKQFWLVIPESSTTIKEGLEIRHLRKLKDQIKSVTTPDDLTNLAKNDQDAENIYQWLKTWCDFSDWEHILKVFNVLEIKTSELETDIEVRAKEKLCQIFMTIKIEEVRRIILSYLDDNATFAGAIRPRQLLYVLKDYLQPSIPRWTQFQRDGLNWNISGIHDLENNNEIERPAIIVPALWPLDNSNTPRSLKISGACKDCPISNSLMRLSLHPIGSFDIYCSDSSWKNTINTKIGGTLGIEKNDFNDSRIVDRLEPFSSSENIKLTSIDEQESLAKELHDEMYKITLKRINLKISEKIQDMVKGDLRTEVESRWKTWNQTLENSIDEQRKLFTKILHPEAEGKSISGELRVGLKTVGLLSEALFLLLVVSVCLGDANNQKWESVKDRLTMTAIGLAYWSGPAGDSKEVIKIDEEISVSKLLENESGQIIIIPQSELPDLIFTDDILGDITKIGLLTHPDYPKLLITKDIYFKRKLKKGDITELKEYFQNSLDLYQSAINKAINEVVA